MANLGYTCSFGAEVLVPSKILSSLISFSNFISFVSRILYEDSISSYKLIKKDRYCLKKVI